MAIRIDAERSAVNANKPAFCRSALFIIIAARFGVFTATEAGAIVHAIALMYYKELRFNDVEKPSAKRWTTVMIVASATTFRGIPDWEFRNVHGVDRLDDRQQIYVPFHCQYILLIVGMFVRACLMIVLVPPV